VISDKRVLEFARDARCVGSRTITLQGVNHCHHRGMAQFVHHPHPRIEERKTQRAPKVADQIKRDSIFSRINARVGLGITLVVGTMWCAYLFAAIAFLSLPSAISSRNLVLIVAWISSNFLQLVLLPIIIVGQNIQARAADARAEATYKDADAILHEALQIQEHLETQDREIEQILAALTELGVKLTPPASPAT